jgi:branched-chain amino acid aminotransferase
MNYKTFINGKFISSSGATISINDAGFLYGDGIFETIRSYRGNPFKFDEHFDRLLYSLKQLKYNPYFERTFIETTVYELLSRNKLSQKDANIKIIITRNGYGPKFHFDQQITPNLIIIAKELESYPDEYYESGVKITVSDLRRNAFSNILYRFKLLNYFENIYARNEAYSRQSFEGIFLTTDRQVLEGSMSNIFCIKDAEVITPPLTQNILPGITRQLVIKLCKENKIKVCEREISYSEMKEADEIFLTNSIMEIMPVNKIDIYKVKGQIPGPITCRLIEQYKKVIRKFLQK